MSVFFYHYYCCCLLFSIHLSVIKLYFEEKTVGHCILTNQNIAMKNCTNWIAFCVFLLIEDMSWYKLSIYDDPNMRAYGIP